MRDESARALVRSPTGKQISRRMTTTTSASQAGLSNMEKDLADKDKEIERLAREAER